MEAMCHTLRERKSKSLDKRCMVERERAKGRKGKKVKKRKKRKEREKKGKEGKSFSYFFFFSTEGRGRRKVE